MAVRKSKDQPPSPIPYGSIVRTTWMDEEFSSHVGYDSDVNEGYESPGIFGVKSNAIDFLLEKGSLDDDCFHTIPHNTRGLMVIDHVWYDDPLTNPDDPWPRIWYHVIWEETTIWIHGRNTVLMKKSTL